MECADPQRSSNRQFWERLTAAAVADRVPLAGGIELTARCNLHCVHCYLGGSTGERDGRPELTAAEWRKQLDAVTRAGCLNLLITGGEPLLRSDFAEIYRHARQNGLLVTVFTNGTRITERIVRLFQAFPPRRVELTLYGATAATCARITGVTDACARARRGLDRLRDGGVPFALKAMLLRGNHHEIPALRALAGEYGVPFRLDGAVNPRLDGDRGVLRHRLAPARIVAHELADPAERAKWLAFYRDHRPRRAAGDRLYTCGAGVTMFYIDAGGRLRPCLMVDTPAADLRTMPFEEAWRHVIPGLATRRAGEDYPCGRCELRHVCSACPAFFRLESGAEDRPSPFVCRLGRRRDAELRRLQTLEEVLP
jgi:radical SAM protein with 4Fe4S-binding SPASM domain